jgi:hypothetical protein
LSLVPLLLTVVYSPFADMATSVPMSSYSALPVTSVAAVLELPVYTYARPFDFPSVSTNPGAPTIVVCPSADMATELPNCELAAPVSVDPRCAHVVPVLSKMAQAPALLSSVGSHATMAEPSSLRAKRTSSSTALLISEGSVGTGPALSAVPSKDHVSTSVQPAASHCPLPLRPTIPPAFVPTTVQSLLSWKEGVGGGVAVTGLW